MIRFDNASDLARQGEITEACRTVRALLTPTLPAGIIGNHLRGFLACVPPRYRTLKTVRDLQEEFLRPR